MSAWDNKLHFSNEKTVIRHNSTKLCTFQYFPFSKSQLLIKAFPLLTFPAPKEDLHKVYKIN